MMIWANMVSEQIILVLLFIFFVRFLLILSGIIKENSKHLPELNKEDIPYVSVIVPARNEEETIASCLLSISENTYPRDKYEIIAINDRSTDNTESEINKVADKIPNLRIKKLEKERKRKNLRGKPGAIQTCIDDAKGEIMLLTDADCKPDKKWIETLVRGFRNKDIGLISSFTHVSGNRFFDRLQSAEWLYLNTIGSAAIGWNKPMSCFGNNLAVRRSDFMNVGGYEKIPFSVTEDLALLHAIHESGKKVRYLPHPDSIVRTKPNKTWRDYFRQHHRWAVGAKDIGILSFLFVLTSVSMWAALFIAIAYNMMPWIFGIIIFRMVIDQIILSYAIYATKMHDLWKWVFPSVFFFMLMELIAPFLLLKKNIIWKDQKFKKKNL